MPKEWKGRVYLDVDMALFTAYIQVYPTKELVMAIKDKDKNRLEKWLNNNKDKIKFIVDRCDYAETIN